MVFANTAGQWGTSSAGEDIADEKMALEVAGGVAAAAKFFAKVPTQYRWMFDSTGLRQAFTEGSERPAKEQRFNEARARM